MPKYGQKSSFGPEGKYLINCLLLPMDNLSLSIVIFNFEWMSWNLALAALPFLLALLLFKTKTKINLLWLVGFILFVLFLPNAPYVITDVIHLYRSSEVVDSFLLLLLLVFEYIALFLIGIFFFVESYRKCEVFFTKRYKVPSLAIRIPGFITIAIGVYLGRSLRFNSWDVFFRPKQVLAGLTYLATLEAFFYTVLFTGFLFAVYFLYIQLKK